MLGSTVHVYVFMSKQYIEMTALASSSGIIFYRPVIYPCIITEACAVIDHLYSLSALLVLIFHQNFIFFFAILLKYNISTCDDLKI